MFEENDLLMTFVGSFESKIVVMKARVVHKGDVVSEGNT